MTQLGLNELPKLPEFERSKVRYNTQYAKMGRTKKLQYINDYFSVIVSDLRIYVPAIDRSGSKKQQDKFNLRIADQFAKSYKFSVIIQYFGEHQQGQEFSSLNQKEEIQNQPKFGQGQKYQNLFRKMIKQKTYPQLLRMQQKKLLRQKKKRERLLQQKRQQQKKQGKKLEQILQEPEQQDKKEFMEEPMLKVQNDVKKIMQPMKDNKEQDNKDPTECEEDIFTFRTEDLQSKQSMIFGIFLDNQQFARSQLVPIEKLLQLWQTFKQQQIRMDYSPASKITEQLDIIMKNDIIVRDSQDQHGFLTYRIRYATQEEKRQLIRKQERAKNIVHFDDSDEEAQELKRRQEKYMKLDEDLKEQYKQQQREALGIPTHGNNSKNIFNCLDPQAQGKFQLYPDSFQSRIKKDYEPKKSRQFMAEDYNKQLERDLKRLDFYEQYIDPYTTQGKVKSMEFKKEMDRLDKIQSGSVQIQSLGRVGKTRKTKSTALNFGC